MTASITLTSLEKIATGLGLSPSTLIDTLMVEDPDIRAFMTNELEYLTSEEKNILRVSIDIIREKRRQREEYQAQHPEEGGTE